MSASPALSTREDYAALDSLAGAKPLRHRYRLLCDQAAAAVRDLVMTVAESGAKLDDLTLTNWGDGGEIRLRLTGLSSAQARDLSDRLYAVPGVTFCQVEHQWV
ncbi:MAG: hypothetical protein KA105_05050 [Caulobacter sp.]|nr:hypothetical protein [Caulobacter sp.]